MVPLRLMCLVLLTGGSALTTPTRKMCWELVCFGLYVDQNYDITERKKKSYRMYYFSFCVKMILWATVKQIWWDDGIITGVNRTTAAAAAAGKVGSDRNDSERTKAVTEKIGFYWWAVSVGLGPGAALKNTSSTSPGKSTTWTSRTSKQSRCITRFRETAETWCAATWHFIRLS